MCGIFGSVGFAPDKGRIDIVRHRGPDGEGWEIYRSEAGPVALGHRRLAILDLSDAGIQPMTDPAGRYSIVFNGEIYNYRELREELRGHGLVFRTGTDTEVLLAGFRFWGEGVLERLRGMFAFLIWDTERQELFAARDRFGIKPLYYVSNGNGTAFASEPKQLLGLPGIPARMNAARVGDFIEAGISDHTAETMFEGVMQLRGGEKAWLRVGSGGRLDVGRYYVPPERISRIAADEAAERFRALLEASVRLHLRSDVPIGSCLSGGLDSSSIVCLMEREFAGEPEPRRRVDTVSACYAEASVDEKPFIDTVVAHAGTRPHYVFPKAEDVFQRASDITWHQDEPFGSTSIFAQWCVFSEARRAGIKVVLDGQGADEQLAGYHGAFRYRGAALARHGRWPELARTMARRRRDHKVGLVRQAAAILSVLLPPGLPRGGRARSPAFWKGSRSPAPAAAPGLAPVRDIDTLCRSMTFATNLPMLLHWEDRNSMAHSIEARVPFLDHPLVEFCLSLGNEHKIVDGETKHVLRRAMKGVLPEAVRCRRDKLGFATPEEAWFRGPLRGLVHEGAESTLSRYPDLLDAGAVRAARDRMLAGTQAFDFALWRIVSLGIWGERFRVGV